MGTCVGSGPPGSSGQGRVRMARDVLGEDAYKRQKGEGVGVGTISFQVGLMPVKKGERGLDRKSPDWYHLRHSQPAQREVTKQKFPFA